MNYEELLSDEQKEKLNSALNAGIVAQNQVQFTLDMIRGLVSVINDEKTGMISTERIRVWIKSLISGISYINNGKI